MKKFFSGILASALCLSITLFSACGGNQGVKPPEQTFQPPSEIAEGGEYTAMKVNGLTQPMGIDRTPVFSWQNASGAVDAKQVAYRVIVSTDAKKAESCEGDMWDSGKKSGANNFGVEYEGKPLAARSRYFWRVCTWENDTAGLWSDVETFETGVTDEWTGEWIGSPLRDDADVDGAKWIWSNPSAQNASTAQTAEAGTQFFRKTFSVNGDVAWAVLTFTADDFGEAYVNGTLAAATADEADSWQSGKAVDVTHLLSSGQNVLAIKVVNKEEYAGALVKLLVKYTNDTSVTVVTDDSWLVSSAEENGWNAAEFATVGWESPNQSVIYGDEPWNSRVQLSGLDKDGAPYVRKAFSIDKPISRARAYVCGLGMHVLSVNGTPADDTVLNPTNTQLNKTVYYQVYDITDKLQTGENAVGVELGRGFYGEDGGDWNWDNSAWNDEPKLLAEIVITYADGTQEKIVTDRTWQVTNSGPLTFNSIYTGEDYDARREISDWNKASYVDSEGLWSAATIVQSPEGRLVWQNSEPMRRVAEREATVSKIANGDYIIRTDLMTTGWAKITFPEAMEEGTTVSIFYGEKTNSRGEVIQPTYNNFNRKLQQYTYIAKGVAGESFEPRFSYSGYQYVQISGYKGTLTADDVTCYLVASDVATTGRLTTGDEMINKLHNLMTNTLANNMQGKPTDTPVWEKNGWLGDLNVAMETFMYNYNVQNFLGEFMNTVRDTQRTDGMIPTIAPSAEWGFENSPIWTSAFIYGVYHLWNYYGDVAIIREFFDAIKALGDNYCNTLANNVWPAQWLNGNSNHGDWVSPTWDNESDSYIASAVEGSNLVCTAYMYGALGAIEEMAAVIGKSTDVTLNGQTTNYAFVRERVYDAFNEYYFDSEKGYYDTKIFNDNLAGNRTRYRQTSNLVPLAMGLVPEEYIRSVIDSVANDVVAKDYHLDTGIAGTRFILPMLAKYGYADLAYRILKQDTYPSWGYWVEQGSTAAWEAYEQSARSNNHYFLGTYDQWLYEGLAGIQSVKNGYETFTVAPSFLTQVGYVSAEIDTVRGRLAVAWQARANGRIDLTVTVPYGSEATVTVPVSDVNAFYVKRSGAAYDVQSSVKDGTITFTLKSGTYEIVTQQAI